MILQGQIFLATIFNDEQRCFSVSHVAYLHMLSSGPPVPLRHVVDARLGKHPGLETDLGGKRRRFVEPLHRGQQDWPLIGGWQQLQLERKLHAPIVG